MQISGATTVVGIVGWPVDHSLSPALHNAAFRARSLDWCYVPFPVRPGSLSQALQGLRAAGVRGCNVTLPHKREALQLATWASETAGRVGAANTLVFREDQLLAHNTDVPGFLNAMVEESVVLKGRRACVLGTGGSARAIAVALIRGGCASICVAGRAQRAAAELAEQLAGDSAGCVLEAVAIDSRLREFTRNVDLVVACLPAQADVPWQQVLQLRAGQVVVDINYHGSQPVLHLAARAGARTITGLGMLVHQAALAFTAWTAVPAPMAAMRAAVESKGPVVHA